MYNRELYKLNLDNMIKRHNYLNEDIVYPFKSSGVVVYSPKLENGVIAESWVLLECDTEIVRYYTYFLNKKGIKLEKPLWGAHISIVRGEYDILPEDYKDKFGYNNGTELSFNYGSLVTNGIHWWLEVESKELEDLRLHLGLDKHPDFGFHITIGRVIENPRF